MTKKLILFILIFAWQGLLAQVIVATGDRCSGNDIAFQLVPPPVGLDSLVWNFDDPGSGRDSVSRAIRPIHRFNSAGTYAVRVRVYANGNPVPTILTLAAPLTIDTSPKNFDFGTDTTICQGSSAILDPYGNQPTGRPQNAPAPAGVSYIWNTGATTQTISVNQAGCYSVTVTDTISGCTFTDKINVKVYRQERRDGGRWFFGNNAGIDFRSGTAQAITSGQVNTTEGSSSVSDLNGRLIFYTDGVTVYDSTGAIMPDTLGLPVTGANGLQGSPASTQSAIIVPQPDDKGCQSLYYIFTTGDVPAGQGLRYSVVDMRLNGGRGAIVEKNVPLVPGTSLPGILSSEKVTAYTSQSGRTFTVTHDFLTNTFRVIPVTQAGLDFSNARTFNLGLPLGPEADKAQGYMKISPDGSKLAITIPGAPGQPNFVEIYEFIDSSGVIRNPIRIQV
ncbi:MAG: hypothetical protein H7Y04_06490, partial [Verrucomicrobia bacterium]|nr:hypothetical protein [Cytophagales bacterium]